MAWSRARPVLRWGVPAGIVAVVLGIAGLTAVTADATATLPPRDAAQLLVDVQTSNVAALSGTVVQSADLGLPDLPVQMGGRGSASFSSLVSGSHTLRVWYGGPDQQRLALMGTLGESDVVRNGTDVWTWSSDDNTATHYQLPPAGTEPTTPDPSVAAMTPQQAADAALAAIDPTTSVTTDGTAEVAGRPAYELVLAPKDSGSLIGQVRIAIDAEQHIPLRVRVFASGAGQPAVEVGFTQISFDPPPAEQFQFTPPPGTTVTDSAASPDAPKQESSGATTAPSDAAEPTVVGSGWTSVLVLHEPKATSPEASGGRSGNSTASDLATIVASLPRVSGEWGGGHLLQSALFTVLMTDDGRVIAGAVGPDQLYRVAAG